MKSSQKSDLIEIFHENRLRIFASNSIFALVFCGGMFSLGYGLDYIFGTEKLLTIVAMVIAFPLLQFFAYKRSHKTIKNLSQK